LWCPLQKLPSCVLKWTTKVTTDLKQSVFIVWHRHVNISSGPLNNIENYLGLLIKILSNWLFMLACQTLHEDWTITITNDHEWFHSISMQFNIIGIRNKIKYCQKHILDRGNLKQLLVRFQWSLICWGFDIFPVLIVWFYNILFVMKLDVICTYYFDVKGVHFFLCPHC
jgi:hypothetical protein